MQYSANNYNNNNKTCLKFRICLWIVHLFHFSSTQWDSREHIYELNYVNVKDMIKSLIFISITLPFNNMSSSATIVFLSHAFSHHRFAPFDNGTILYADDVIALCKHRPHTSGVWRFRSIPSSSNETLEPFSLILSRYWTSPTCTSCRSIHYSGAA